MRLYGLNTASSRLFRLLRASVGLFRGLLFLPLLLPGENLVEESDNLAIFKTGDGSYRVEIANPVRPEQTLTYFLSENAAEKPRPYSKDPGNPDTAIPIPAKRIVSLSTTYVGAFEALGATDSIIAVDEADYLFSEDLRQRGKDGSLLEVGGAQSLDLEAIITAKPDLILLTRINPGQESLEERLRASGIPVLVTAAWRENEPLGRSEWIKLFGILTGEREKAFEIFDASRTRYRHLQETVKAASPTLPKVLLSAPFGGTWYMPGGASYTAQFLTDAGAESLWKNDESTGSFPVDLEAAMVKGFDADFWLNPGRYATREEMATADVRFAVLPVFQERQIYNRIKRVGPTGGNDFWESGIIHPDRILADLIKIFHPELVPDHEFYYYERLP